MERITGKENPEEMTFEVGSGNVYADLGYDDPEEMAAKANLARQIRATMEARDLSQTRAAKIMGIDQPTLSKLLRGVIRNVTIDRLSLMLRRLGRNVTIIIEPAAATGMGAETITLGHFQVRDQEKPVPAQRP